MTKRDYFPRVAMYEEVQDLAASFMSSGKNLAEYDHETRNMLSKDDQSDFEMGFYLPLLLLALAPKLDLLCNLVSSIVRRIRSSRRVQLTISTTIEGELDVDKYVELNKVGRAVPKLYPSKVKVPTFQKVEYQLVFRVILDFRFLVDTILQELNIQDAQVISLIKDLMVLLRRSENALRNKYSVTVSKKESYGYLKDKVERKYRTRQLSTPEFRELIAVYEDVFSIRSLDREQLSKIDTMLFDDSFDDRLFELWCLNGVCTAVTEKFGGEATVTPLFVARRQNKPAIRIELQNEHLEIWYQNRKAYLDYQSLQWYYTDNGRTSYLDAIPDILIRRKDKQTGDYLGNPILIDAKNRLWDFSDMKVIKPELAYLVYVRDNFSTLFDPHFHAVLIAHNPGVNILEKSIYNKGDPFDRIVVVSLGLATDRIDPKAAFGRVLYLIEGGVKYERRP